MMGDRREITTKISIAAKAVKAGRNEDKQSVLDQEKNDTKTANIEPFGSGMGARKRQPGSTSRNILQEEAEEGQPVMRANERTSKSASPEEQINTEGLSWARYSEVNTEDENKEKSPSPRLKVTKWATADLHRGESVTHIILAMRDFVLYAIYLTTLLILVFGSHDYAYNYYAVAVSDLVTKSKFECTFGDMMNVETFETLKTPQHVWCFLEKILLPFLYADNGTSRWVLTENALVGAPAMIQVRVKNETCRTAAMFKDLFKTCYDYYHEDIADTDDFGDRSLPFRWKASELDIVGGSRSKRRGDVRGGYQFNFTTDYNFTKNWLLELQKKLWIQQGTRFVTIDFILYTPNTNLFLVVKLDFEFVPAGGVLTSSFFYTWKILRYVRKWDLFIMSCEVLNAMFVIYFTFEEATQMRLLGSKYLDNRWNILDTIIILLSYMAITVAIWRFVRTLQVMPDKIRTINTNYHSCFDELIGIESSFITIGAVLIFFAWLKLLKFATLFRSMTLILTSIERVGPELAILFVQAIIISIAFAILGQTLFGQHVVQFSTPTSSFFAMIGIYVGRMYFYRECLKTHPVIGPLYFVAYIILVCMLHLNAFVGAVVHGYREAHNLLNEQPQRQYMGDLVFSAVIQLLNRLGSDRLLRALLVRNIIQRRKTDFDEFELILKRHSIHGLELRLLLFHYELKRGNEMSLDKFLDIYNDVLARHQLRIESEGHGSALELIQKTEQLLTSCNTALLDVQSKVDVLIDKLLSDSSKELLKKKKKKDARRWF